MVESITVSDDGVTLPVQQLLTGRGFVTGKSGSGKSNTVSVIVEELLEGGFPLLIVDTDGEYLGLTEAYEILHVGATAECDRQVDASNAGRVAELALRERLPVILDVSGYVDPASEHEVVAAVVRELFRHEGDYRVPFLLVVEEMHEYLPESGKTDEVGEALVQVAKRGRKRGLGVCGLSQRPAAVAKEFITQCDWLVWHRLTWENDTKVVGRVLDSEWAETVEDLEDGEAILVTDWDDGLRRVQFRRKRTRDVGATPSLDRATAPGSKRAVLAELDDPDGPVDRGEAETAGGDEDATSDGSAASTTGSGGSAGSPSRGAPRRRATDASGRTDVASLSAAEAMREIAEMLAYAVESVVRGAARATREGAALTAAWLRRSTTAARGRVRRADDKILLLTATALLLTAVLVLLLIR